jgi:hypothetical protein
MFTDAQLQSLIEAIQGLSATASRAAEESWGPSEYLAGAALAVSTVVALSVFLLQKSNEDRQRKIDLTLSIFFQWDSFEMLGIRVEAERILKSPEFQGKAYIEIYETLRSRKKLNEWRNVSRLLHFCEMLADLLRSSRLDPSLFRTVFTRDLTFWCSELIPILSHSSDTAERAASIRHLQDFLKKQS